MMRFAIPTGLNACLAVVAVLTVTELAVGAELYRRLHGDRRALAAARGSATRQLHERFAPGPANEAAILVDVAAIQARVESLRRDIASRQISKVEATVRDPVSGYFALAQWMEKTRVRAEGRGIAIKPGECFAFRFHLKQAPPADWIEIVAEQHAAAGQLVDWLIDCRPIAIESLQREHPEIVRTRRRLTNGSTTTQSVSSPSGGNEASTDFFAAASSTSAAMPGALSDRLAFKVVVTGETSVLLRIVDRLSADDSPFIVRELAVQKIDAVGSGASPAGRNLRGKWADVGGTLSRYTLVIDLGQNAADPSTDPRRS